MELRQLSRRMLGRPADWQLRRPRRRQARPGVAWIGTIGLLASLAVSWFAFRGARGEEGNVAFGLYVGATSIVLMAWSFLLALRLRVLEPLFGGLDRMYRVHRWAGVAAIVAMFLHVRAEPEVDGIPGAGRALAAQAEGLAGTAEIMLYLLVGLSLIRWFPYRVWRWTHKLLGVPFVFACAHFVTAEKPYANASPWGWWFGGLMAVGAVAWVWRVLGRDVVARGRRYRVARHTTDGDLSTLELEPVGDPLDHRVGQFAFLRIERRGLREPHPFTIASAPGEPRLRFVVKGLGDWSDALGRDDVTGAEVAVEGPYGRFRPEPGAGSVSHVASPIWIAGGVGITPFLSALRARRSTARPPARLLYAVREDAGAIVDEVREAAADGLVELHLFVSSAGRRLDEDSADRALGADAWQGAHVAVCGPSALVARFASHAERGGAADVETEDFDIRQGVGPDLSRDIDAAARRLARATPQSGSGVERRPSTTSTSAARGVGSASTANHAAR